MRPVESRKQQTNPAKSGHARAVVPSLLPVLSALAILLHTPHLHAQIEWTPEEQISLDDVYDDWFPEIAAGPDGKVWVVWQGSDGYDPEIMYSVNEGNGWSYPDRVNTDDYAEDSLPDIAVGPDGNPWVVWGKSVGGHSKLYWSRWEGTGWRPEERVFPELGDEEPYAVADIAMEDIGTPWMEWTWPGATGGRVACYSRWQDGSWAPAETLLASPQFVGCLLAGDPSGGMWAVLPYTVAGETNVFFTCWHDGTWAPMDTVSGATGASAIAVEPAGALWIGWQDEGAVYAVRYLNGAWSQPEIIAAPDSGATGIGHMRACCPDLAVSPVGLVWTTWREYFFGVGESSSIVYASRRGSSGWTPKEQVSGAYGFVEGFCQIALNSSGVAWIVWQGWDGRDYEILGSHSVGVSAEEIAMGHGRPVLRWSPNPMGTSAILQGDILGATGRPILIYDTSGRLVRRIDGRALTNDGAVQVSWDSRGSDGHLVPTGTYIWRTQAGGDRHEGVVVVIR